MGFHVWNRKQFLLMFSTYWIPMLTLFRFYLLKEKKKKKIRRNAQSFSTKCDRRILEHTSLYHFPSSPVPSHWFPFPNFLSVSGKGRECITVKIHEDYLLALGIKDVFVFSLPAKEKQENQSFISSYFNHAYEHSYKIGDFHVRFKK